MLTAAFSRRALAACFAAAVSWTGASQADPVTFKVPLSGAEELPPVQTAGSGVAELAYDSSTRTLKWAVTYNGLSGPATMAHFHGPAPPGGEPDNWTSYFDTGTG
jgi:CHRD domain